MRREVTLDVEANGLLDDSTIDYSASPYKLKDSFKLWCIVCKDINTEEVFRFVGEDEYQNSFIPFTQEVGKVIVHNGINYDLLVLKMLLGIDYHIPHDLGEKSLWGGRPVEIVDTLVISKTLDPSKRGGHSLDAWGERLGLSKIDWRERAISLGLISRESPKGAEFQQYHPEMVEYCVRDCEVTGLLYKHLIEAMGDWPWQDAIQLESKVTDIITRQSHRGFHFFKEHAEACVRDLDEKINAAKLKVEPILPPKPLTKTALKAYIPPQKWINKDSTISSHMTKFVEKHNGRLFQTGDKWQVELFGEIRDLPLPQEPLVKYEPMTLKDSTLIKEWLVSLGWQPLEYKERDLTYNSKKEKLTQEKFEAAAKKYIEQTLASNFCADRCERLKCKPSELKSKILNHDISKPLKVLTNPTYTVGQEKDLCPNLVKLQDKFPYALDIVQFLTYQHRRNSLLGGGFDPDEEEEEPEKGYLANIRQDGRIPTPADSCAAASSRFKHRLVTNVPRNTSLYGEAMRACFGVTNDYIQVGYDFDSLEARVEGHYVYPYESNPNKPYVNSLLQEKPNDVHTKTAEFVTNLVGFPFSRGAAKAVKYASSYGAQAPRVAKTVGCDLKMGEEIFNGFWEAAKPLALFREAITKFWKTKGNKTFIIGIDKRKILTRSAHSLVNYAFQSTGVTCAKRAMVIHEKLLIENNLYVDFFKDDWEKSQYCQQLIAYHDEAQLEVRKELVKIKTFPFEKGNKESEKQAKEQAQLFKQQQEDKTGLRFSDLGHTDSSYYVGYCLAGDLATKAVKLAGEYYKLRVDLTAGYALGRNWGQCH